MFEDTQDAIQFADEAGSLDVFSSNKMICKAVVMSILNIGELTKHLPQEYKTTHDEIPWKSISGMRDIAAHGYHTMNHKIIWDVVTNYLPDLAKFLQNQLKNPEMTAENAIEIIKLIEQNGIEVYIDGGWGVDALLGEQTRKHDDLDIALPHKFVPLLRELLESRGYKDVPRDDTRDCNFVLGDDNGNLIDVHSYTFDENGKHIFGVAYEPYQLTGTGTINGYPVKCIPPDVMVEFHTGYEVDDNDYHDVKALCNRFNIPMPSIYEKFDRACEVDSHM
jgi:lincosamide nucleotidyltransferase A/C/D/E